MGLVDRQCPVHNHTGHFRCQGPTYLVALGIFFRATGRNPAAQDGGPQLAWRPNWRCFGGRVGSALAKTTPAKIMGDTLLGHPNIRAGRLARLHQRPLRLWP